MGFKGWKAEMVGRLVDSLSGQGHRGGKEEFGLASGAVEMLGMQRCVAGDRPARQDT